MGRPRGEKLTASFQKYSPSHCTWQLSCCIAADPHLPPLQFPLHFGYNLAESGPTSWQGFTQPYHHHQWRTGSATASSNSSFSLQCCSPTNQNKDCYSLYRELKRKNPIGIDDFPAQTNVLHTAFQVSRKLQELHWVFTAAWASRCKHHSTGDPCTSTSTVSFPTFCIYSQITPAMFSVTEIVILITNYCICSSSVIFN